MSVGAGFRGIYIDVEQSEDFSLMLQRFPAAAKRSASRAINRTMERTLIPDAREEMRRQVNFPPGYLEGDRLSVVKYAHPEDLEGRVRGRGRATSLLRFMPGVVPSFGRGKGGVFSVSVKPGHAEPVKGFFLKLRSGNVGFAIRLRPGEVFTNKREPKPYSPKHPDIFLLYGPSVDQALVDVSAEIEPQVVGAMGAEFFRLMDVEFRGKTEDDA